MTAPTRNERVLRFSPLERAMHWCTAALAGACIVTAAALSIAPVSTLVGRRDLVKQVHVACGLLLAVAILVPMLMRDVRAEVRTLAWFDDDDLRWFRGWFPRLRLRRADRRPWAGGHRHADRRPRADRADRARVRPAKFHPGQKLNAAATAAAITVLYATGIVLRWFDPFPLWVREGATFVHDWTAFLFTILVAVHVLRALTDPASLRGMVTGSVDRAWALHKHPRWLTPPSEASPDPIPGAPSPSGARTGRSSR